MSRAPRITRLAVHRFSWQRADLGVDGNGFNHVYQRGSCLDQTGYVLTIEGSGLEAIDSRGQVPVPTGPGLGAPVNWDDVSRQQTDRLVYG